MKIKIKRRSHSFTIGINRTTGKPIKVMVKCRNAPSAVDLVTVRKDAQKGDPGCVGSCMLAETILRAAEEGVLPHPAYHVEVVHGYVYIVHKRTALGMPTACLRYRHNMSKWISEFDRSGGKSCLVGQWKEDLPLHLSVPTERGSQAGTGKPKGKSTGTRSSHRYMTKPRLRGALRRAKDAGLTFHAA